MLIDDFPRRRKLALQLLLASVLALIVNGIFATIAAIFYQNPDAFGNILPQLTKAIHGMVTSFGSVEIVVFGICAAFASIFNVTGPIHWAHDEGIKFVYQLEQSRRLAQLVATANFTGNFQNEHKDLKEIAVQMNADSWKILYFGKIILLFGLLTLVSGIFTPWVLALSVTNYDLAPIIVLLVILLPPVLGHLFEVGNRVFMKSITKQQAQPVAPS